MTIVTPAAQGQENCDPTARTSRIADRRLHRPRRAKRTATIVSLGLIETSQGVTPAAQGQENCDWIWLFLFLAANLVTPAAQGQENCDDVADFAGLSQTPVTPAAQGLENCDKQLAAQKVRCPVVTPASLALTLPVEALVGESAKGSSASAGAEA